MGSYFTTIMDYKIKMFIIALKILSLQMVNNEFFIHISISATCFTRSVQCSTKKNFNKSIVSLVINH